MTKNPDLAPSNPIWVTLGQDTYCIGPVWLGSRWDNFAPDRPTGAQAPSPQLRPAWQANRGSGTIPAAASGLVPASGQAGPHLKRATSWQHGNHRDQQPILASVGPYGSLSSGEAQPRSPQLCLAWCLRPARLSPHCSEQNALSRKNIFVCLDLYFGCLDLILSVWICFGLSGLHFRVPGLVFWALYTCRVSVYL